MPYYVPDDFIYPELSIDGFGMPEEMEIKYESASTRNLIRAFNLNPRITRGLINHDEDDGGFADKPIEYNGVTFTDGHPTFVNNTDSIGLFYPHAMVTAQRRLFSFSCRFYLTDLAADRTVIGGGGSHLNIRVLSSTSKLRVSPEGNSSVVDSIQDIDLNTVYDIVFINDQDLTVDGVNGKFLYINGVLDNETTSTAGFSWSIDHLLLGKRADTTRTWIGWIDSPAVWDVPISQGVISELHRDPNHIYQTSV